MVNFVICWGVYDEKTINSNIIISNYVLVMLYKVEILDIFQKKYKVEILDVYIETNRTRSHKNGALIHMLVLARPILLQGLLYLAQVQVTAFEPQNTIVGP